MHDREPAARPQDQLDLVAAAIEEHEHVADERVVAERVADLIRPELPATEAELDAADDAVDRPDDSLDPHEAEATPGPVAAASTEVTTARATLDFGDQGAGGGAADLRRGPAARCAG